MRSLIVAVLALAPSISLANGGDGGSDGADDAPPPVTQTSEDCKKGEVWDEKTETCLESSSSLLNDDQRYIAVRELAYVGRPADAKLILDSMTEGKTARVMTYEGFLLRKTGHVEEGIAAYEEAIRLDPANILARNYYGQLLVEMDEIQLAQLQLDEIRAHGGTGTWSERSLATAIETGVTYNF